MKKYRTEKDLPKATSKYGWRFQNLGISNSKPRTGE
jgi:hypothetical protein